MWDLIVSVPDHCLSFYFKKNLGMLNILLRSNNFSYKYQANGL